MDEIVPGWRGYLTYLRGYVTYLRGYLTYLHRTTRRKPTMFGSEHGLGLEHGFGSEHGFEAEYGFSCRETQLVYYQLFPDFKLSAITMLISVFN